MTRLLDHAAVVQRIFDHIDHRTTDVGEASWREPVEHYRSPARFAAECELLRRSTTALCPSAALAEPGAYVAREVFGTPVLAVRGADGRVRAFRNACRHRGARLAAGSGCEKAFVCRYHGWTYGLDGALRHVPHEYGFPGLEKETRGLVALPTRETHGLVFVTQAATGASPDPTGALEALPPLLGPGRRLVQATEQEIPANWKLFVESFLEGYHIRATHRGTFYPVQYDNLNVVELFGRNSRVVFPYRSVEKLRGAAVDAAAVEGKLTYVHHLFPNVMVATFPHFVFMVAIEPLAIDRTRAHTYITAAGGAADDAEPERRFRTTSAEGAALIAAGAAEDNAVVCAIQEGLASGANEYFEFGRFEEAIGHFHRNLRDALSEDTARGESAGTS